jgi:N-acetylglutamate synthase-like GNAT family acetyltransferase
MAVFGGVNVNKCQQFFVLEILLVIADLNSDRVPACIPADYRREPYLSKDGLLEAIEQGVAFWGVEHEDRLAGVISLQNSNDAMLIRHACVRTDLMRRGLGTRLLCYLLSMVNRPYLVHVWSAADHAIRFYEKSGFRPVDPPDKDRLLSEYLDLPAGQTETSVVLGDERWHQMSLA